jgi:hypothetical protein
MLNDVKLPMFLFCNAVSSALNFGLCNIIPASIATSAGGGLIVLSCALCYEGITNHYLNTLAERVFKVACAVLLLAAAPYACSSILSLWDITYSASQVAKHVLTSIFFLTLVH